VVILITEHLITLILLLPIHHHHLLVVAMDTALHHRRLAAMPFDLCTVMELLHLRVVVIVDIQLLREDMVDIMARTITVMAINTMSHIIQCKRQFANLRSLHMIEDSANNS
jgi:hypothetical protein